MKAFMLKSFMLMTIIGQLLLIASLVVFRSYIDWKQEPPELIAIIPVAGVIVSLIAHISGLTLFPIAKKQDELDQYSYKLDKREKELDKLINFLKIKAFRSAIVSKEEVSEYMGWKEKES